MARLSESEFRECFFVGEAGKRLPMREATISVMVRLHLVARMPAVQRLPPAQHKQTWFARWGLLPAVLGSLCPVSVMAQQAANEALRQAMRQGNEAMIAGNFDGAVAAYSSVTQQSSGFAEGYLNLGLALYQADRLPEARAALEKALRLKPGLRGDNLFLGIIAYRENRFKDAEWRLKLETQVDPHSAKALMWLGVCRLAQDDPQGAIAALDKAYALDASDVDILYHRGRAYLLVANASYDAMYKLNPDSERVHQVLAEAYAQAYRNQEAIGELEVAMKIAPRQPGLHEELGDQEWTAGKLDKATEAYREELRIDGHNVTAMYKLGSLLVQGQYAAEGVQLLREALRRDPSLSDAHYYLGCGLMGTDRIGDAAREFQLTIAADPSNDRAMSSYYKLALAYRQLHQTQAAQEAIENFQRMRAQFKERHDKRAAQIVRKRTELPVDDLDKVALAGNP
jgi:tetratricopeptide (TPR) repeat protein